MDKDYTVRISKIDGYLTKGKLLEEVLNDPLALKCIKTTILNLKAQKSIYELFQRSQELQELCEGVELDPKVQKAYHKHCQDLARVKREIELRELKRDQSWEIAGLNEDSRIKLVDEPELMYYFNLRVIMATYAPELSREFNEE